MYGQRAGTQKTRKEVEASQPTPDADNNIPKTDSSDAVKPSAASELVDSLAAEAVARSHESLSLAGVCEPLGSPAAGQEAAAVDDQPVGGAAVPGQLLTISYVYHMYCEQIMMTVVVANGTHQHHCKTCRRI